MQDLVCFLGFRYIDLTTYLTSSLKCLSYLRFHHWSDMPNLSLIVCDSLKASLICKRSVGLSFEHEIPICRTDVMQAILASLILTEFEIPSCSSPSFDNSFWSAILITLSGSAVWSLNIFTKAESFFEFTVCRSFSSKHLQQQYAIAVDITLDWNFVAQTILCNHKNIIVRKHNSRFSIYICKKTFA